MIHIYSGDCRMCQVGIETPFIDMKTRTPIFTGDILIIQKYDSKTGLLDYMSWGLTTAVRDDYTTYSNGEIVAHIGASEPFVMGLRKATFSDLNDDDGEHNWSDGWVVTRVKSYKDVVDNEHWTDYGFNFKNINENEKDETNVEHN